MLCSFVEQYFVEGATPYKQADSVLEECSRAGLPNGTAPHQHEPEAEAPSPSAGDSVAQAAKPDRVLGSQPSMPLNARPTESDADEAVLDESHHSHVAGGRSQFSRILQAGRSLAVCQF